MRYTIKNDKGKDIPFKFVNKKYEEEYIKICEEWCGGVPIDVTWAKQTQPYKRIEKELKENKHEKVLDRAGNGG